MLKRYVVLEAALITNSSPLKGCDKNKKIKFVVKRLWKLLSVSKFSDSNERSTIGALQNTTHTLDVIEKETVDFFFPMWVSIQYFLGIPTYPALLLGRQWGWWERGTAPSVKPVWPFCFSNSVIYFKMSLSPRGSAKFHCLCISTSVDILLVGTAVCSLFVDKVCTKIFETAAPYWKVSAVGSCCLM